MSVLLEFTMFPTDKGESVSAYVSRLVKVIRESGMSYQLTPMGTVIETENMPEALALVNTCYEQLEPDCNRIYASLTFDIRRGAGGRMKQKIASIEKQIGKV